MIALQDFFSAPSVVATFLDDVDFLILALPNISTYNSAFILSYKHQTINSPFYTLNFERNYGVQRKSGSRFMCIHFVMVDMVFTLSVWRLC